MSYLDCYEVLGVRPGASPEQVHRAYKRLALAHHPDRTGGDPLHVARFCRVTEAYMALRQAPHLARRPRLPGRCPKCHHVEELYKALDGGQYCAPCLLNTRRRSLPRPRLQAVKCITAILFQASACCWAMAAAAAADWRSGTVGALCVLASIFALTYNVCTADIIDH